MPFKSSGRGAYGPQGQKVIKGPLAPVWVTFSPGAVGTAAFSYTFVATDDSGDAPTYSVASGALPTGLTLNSTTGVLSGTATASGTFTYTLRATDVNGRFADTTSISQVVSLSLYTFTSATFGTGGQTGQSGPDINQARSAVGNPSWANTYLTMSYTGIQDWTVPGTGSYTIVAAGAKGGNDGSSGGPGRIISTTGTLTQGEVLHIVVGQQGSQNNDGGGGGGSFVYRGASGISYSASDIIVAAGGGSGANNQAGSSSGEAGSFADQRNYGPPNTGSSGWAGEGQRPVNPLGYGGRVCGGGEATNGASNSNNYGGGCGAGFLSRGEGTLDRSGNQGGGGYGGNSGSDTSSNSGGSGQPWRGGSVVSNGGVGGFGGGGGGSNDCGGSGAGGGYTGGYSNGCYTVGGGGSSNVGSGWSKTDGGTNSGTGYVTITKN